MPKFQTIILDEDKIYQFLTTCTWNEKMLFLLSFNILKIYPLWFPFELE
jgi:hypothetical protein